MSNAIRLNNCNTQNKAVTLQTFPVRQRFIIIFSLFLVTLSGCEYQKVLKKGSLDEKYEAAKKYYKKADYARASIMLEQIVGKFGRTDKGQEVYFLYSYCHYGMNDYALASYHFENYVDRYQTGKYTEEAAFMIAKCAYAKTLSSELDQTATKKAIESIQIFINRYPGSSYVEKGNELIDQLRSRLHDKAFSTAMLYYNMENYLSAYTSLKNAIIDYPDLPNKEHVEYLIVRSAYLYAKQSVLKAQLNRYEKAVDEADEFLVSHTNSEYQKEVEEIKKKCQTKINGLSGNSKETGDPANKKKDTSSK